MKIITDVEISNIMLEFVPTSMFINGVQTYAYNLRDKIVFFDMNVAAGSEITAIPAEAIRFIDESTEVLLIDVVGFHSVFSDPFGAVELSLDNITWVKSLSHVFPATVYLRQGPHDAVLDVLCRGNVELVIWRGTDDTIVNEDGLVALVNALPIGATPGIGGVEYNAH